jgi:hypothetical protein
MRVEDFVFIGKRGGTAVETIEIVNSVNKNLSVRQNGPVAPRSSPDCRCLPHVRGTHQVALFIYSFMDKSPLLGNNMHL